MGYGPKLHPVRGKTFDQATDLRQRDHLIRLPMQQENRAGDTGDMIEGSHVLEAVPRHPLNVPQNQGEEEFRHMALT